MMTSKLNRVVILGAGGHGQVAAEIILSSPADSSVYELVGFLDDDQSLEGKILLGIPVLGPLSKLGQIPHDGIFIAIGNNSTRSGFYQHYLEQEEKPVNLIHHSAIMASDVVLGKGVMVAPGVIVNTGSVIGNNVILNTGSTVDHHNQIGDHVHIGPGAHLGGDVVVDNGSLIGIGSIIIPQRKVGAWSVIGAGSVVTKNISDNVVAVGIPATITE